MDVVESVKKDKSKDKLLNVSLNRLDVQYAFMYCPVLSDQMCSMHLRTVLFYQTSCAVCIYVLCCFIGL